MIEEEEEKKIMEEIALVSDDRLRELATSHSSWEVRKAALQESLLRKLPKTP